MTKFLTAVLLFLCLAFALADNIRVVAWNLEWFTPSKLPLRLAATSEQLPKILPRLPVLSGIHSPPQVYRL